MAGRKAQQHGNSKDLRMRQQLAQEAARLMAEEGITDYHSAKHKAALRLHAPNTHNLPRNDEIQAALHEYHRLFKADSQAELLKQLRQIGAKAMVYFKEFEPRLVGAVADGSATEFSEITLHLFSDFQEALALFLDERHIPYQQSEQLINMKNGEIDYRPGYHIMLQDTPLLLVVFDHKGLRQAPSCPTTGQPMQRLKLDKLEALIQISE